MNSENFDFVTLKRAARYLVGKPKAALRFRRQEHVDTITVFVDSDFAGDPVSRMSTTRLVGQMGNPSVKSGSTLQSLIALSVGEAEFYALVKEGQVGLSFRSIYMDMGIPRRLKYKLTLLRQILRTDRLGAGPRTKQIDTRIFFGVQSEFKNGDISIKKVPTAMNCSDVGTKPVSASVLQQHRKLAGLVFF